MANLFIRSTLALAAVAALSGAAVSCSGDPAIGGGGGTRPGDRPASRAFGVWTPPSAQAGETLCTKAQHDRFMVIGPDGKRYPTWHPPTLTENGVTCSFGHEHGPDPSAPSTGFDGWDDLRRHFAFDANGNGTIDESELAQSGIPFGYVSEQASGAGALSVEPHESYKIVFANDRARLRQFNLLQSTDVTCDLLLAFNQDTSTAAALTNHRHSVIYFADCASVAGASLPAYRAKVIASALVPYGEVNAIVDVTEASAAAGRQVPTAERAYSNILVLTGQSSDYRRGLRERWNGVLNLRRADGSLLAGMDVGVGTDDPARFAATAGNLSARNSIDLCYLGLDAAGNDVGAGAVRQARGGACAALSASGPTVPVASRLTAQSKDSPFKGCQRFAQFAGLTVRNNSGTRIWYTDVNGANAVSTVGAGLLKQWVELSDTGASVLLEDPSRVESPSAQCAAANGVRAPN